MEVEPGQAQDQAAEVNDCGRPLIGPCGCRNGLCAEHRFWHSFQQRRPRERGSGGSGAAPAHGASAFEGVSNNPIPEVSSEGAIPARAWRELQGLDLEATIRQRVSTVREPPRWFRGQLKGAFQLAMRERQRRPEAAWKLF
eukprot:11777210-Karenia_brevis.AAC.1